MKNQIIKTEYDNRIEYRLNGKYHREDGPAIEWASGSKYWFKHGIRHRNDGPAVEYFDGEKCWFINGIKYSEEEFNQYILQKKLSKI